MHQICCKFKYLTCLLTFGFLATLPTSSFSEFLTDSLMDQRWAPMSEWLDVDHNWIVVDTALNKSKALVTAIKALQRFSEPHLSKDCARDADLFHPELQWLISTPAPGTIDLCGGDIWLFDVNERSILKSISVSPSPPGVDGTHPAHREGYYLAPVAVHEDGNHLLILQRFPLSYIGSFQIPRLLNLNTGSEVVDSQNLIVTGSEVRRRILNQEF